MEYLLLQNPGHNRVYYKMADKMALAELTLACQHLSVQQNSIQIRVIEDIRYLSFNTNAVLEEKDLELISRLSFVFAIYCREIINGKTYLAPLKRNAGEYLDNKVSSILKYPGKTNELFTRMMINVAFLSSESDKNERINLLDPVSGRGTTLFEAAVYGYDAYGVDIEQKSIHDSAVFFKKYLQNERYKHILLKRQVAGKAKSDAVHMDEFIYAKTKEDFKSPETTRTLGLICGDSSNIHLFFKKNFFNIIAGDLPYGIFHGNKEQTKSASKTRNPSGFLSKSLPAWHNVLIPGGVVVVAWNSFIISRQKLADTFQENGFRVLSNPPYDQFEHMVDKSIKRDILVATK